MSSQTRNKKCRRQRRRGLAAIASAAAATATTPSSAAATAANTATASAAAAVPIDANDCRDDAPPPLDSSPTPEITATQEDGGSDGNNNGKGKSSGDVREGTYGAPPPVVVPSKLDQMWNSVQSTVNQNFLPLVSSLCPDELLTSLLGDATDDATGGRGPTGRKKEVRLKLLSTSAQLFSFVEHLAGMDEKLREVERCRKMMEFRDDGDYGVEKKVDAEGKYGKVEEEDSDRESCILSGLSSLYTGQDTDVSTKEATVNVVVDAETVWGQVELQNDALMARLKRMIKKLSKRISNKGGQYSEEEIVRVLDLSALESDESFYDVNDDDDDGGGDNDGVSQGSTAYSLNQDEEEHNDDDSNVLDEDSDARQMHERMEKAMASMGENDDDEEEPISDRKALLEGLTSNMASSKAEAGDKGIDPYRERMRDGFFDLHEMEAFADEEEEMLPSVAYGTEMPEGSNERKKTSNNDELKEGKLREVPHLQDRMGRGDLDIMDEVELYDNDDDDGNDLLTKLFQPTPIPRRRYRADDEVEALHQLYEDGQDQNDGYNDSKNEVGGVDVSAMTAVDLFGIPDEKLIRSYISKNNMKRSSKNGGDGRHNEPNKKGGTKTLLRNDAGVDLWDDHNFEEGGMDWKGGAGIDHDNKEGDVDLIGIEEGGDVNVNEKDKGDIDNAEGQIEILSAHAIQSRKLEQQTICLEQDMMSEKPWSLMGEVKGTNRVVDSLLESTPEFELAFKPPSILTVAHTTSMEEMIKKRIIDGDWDDVIPRELPDIVAHRNAGDTPEVSQEKSKLGLGELYEREYLKKTSGYDRTASEKQMEEDAVKEEMKRLFANLCSQLDALSNYHFAPRPVADDADVRNCSEDAPAIAMEEVLPLHVSQSRGVAPEEVYAGGKGRKGVLKGESELDQVERRRALAAKKAVRRKARKQKYADERLISKLQPGLGLNNPYEKRKFREELQLARTSGKVVIANKNKGLWDDEAAASKEYQTSTKFFKKMQENMEDMIRGGDDGKGRQPKKKRKGLEAGQASSVYRL